MKNEETKYEETLYEDNQVNPSNEVDENKETNVKSEESKKDGSTWRKAGIGMGLGILLGSTTSFMTSSIVEENPIKPDNPVKPDKPTDEQQPEWTDGKVDIATTVNDEMSFSQAFGAARAEVGAGGAFEWRGNVYSTYTAEEWNGMSAEERNEYNEHFNWSRHEAATSQNATTSTTSTATAVHQTATDEPVKPEATTAETSTEEPIVEVDVCVQETEPEIEILGVMHDDETGYNLGLMTVEEQDFLFIDVDDNGEFDVVISDVNGDGEVTGNETMDVSDYHMSVSDFESNSFINYAATDDTDYINDADGMYEA